MARRASPRTASSMVRLDAVGYVIKKAGTSCFMVEPEIYEFLDWVVGGGAATLGLTLLPEVHDVPRDASSGSRRGASGRTTSCCPGSSSTPLSDRRGRAAGRAPGRVARRAGDDARLPRWDPDPTGPRRHPAPGRDARAGRHRRSSEAATSTASCRRSHAADGVDVHQLNLTYFSALGDGRATGTSRPARSSSSPGASRRSTTSGCSPARTTPTPSRRPGKAARSTATTTRRPRSGTALRAAGRPAAARA